MFREAKTWLFSLCLLGIVVGCGRQKIASSPTPDAASAPPDTATAGDSNAVVAPVIPVVIDNSAAVASQLAQLTEAVRKYSFEHRRLAKTLDEVVAAGYVSALPAAPAGKKFSIDSRGVQVVLVNQ